MSLIDNFSHPLVYTLGWTLFHSIWQILLISLLWHIIRYSLRKSAAILRYNLSLIALLSIPVISLFNFFRQYETYRQASRIATLQLESGIFEAASPSGKFITLIQNNIAGFVRGFESFAPWLVWIYLVGLICLSLITLGKYARLHNLKRRQILPLPKEWNSKAGHLKSRIGLKRKVEIFRSSKISVPMVMGLIRPTILLPLAMFSSLSVEQVESILLHEFYHLKRKDHYVNALQNLIEIVFFYHPCTWWISRRLREDRENCVDERVVEFTSNPLSYVRALMALKEDHNLNLQPVLTATQSNSLLLKRMKNILTMKTKSFNSVQKLAALLVILVTTLSIAWINPPAIRVQHPSNSDFEPLINLDLGAYTSAEASPAYNSQDPKPVITEKAVPDTAETNCKPAKVIIDLNTDSIWQGFSDEDRAEIREAIKQLEDASLEILEYLQSEEFKQQIKKAQKEILDMRGKVFQELENARNSWEELESEDFKRDIKREWEELEKEIEDFRREIRQINPEEFRQKIEKLRKEFKKAIDDFHRELNKEAEEPGEITGFLNNFYKTTIELEIQKTLNEFSDPFGKNLFDKFGEMLVF